MLLPGEAAGPRLLTKGLEMTRAIPSISVRRWPFAVRRSPFAVWRSPFSVRRAAFGVRRGEGVLRFQCTLGSWCLDWPRSEIEHEHDNEHDLGRSSGGVHAKPLILTCLSGLDSIGLVPLGLLGFLPGRAILAGCFRRNGSSWPLIFRRVPSGRCSNWIPVCPACAGFRRNSFI
jgi:hypothetical protein